MAGRVEPHSPGLSGLEVRKGGTGVDRAPLGGGDVVDLEVDMELLAADVVRPRRRGVVANLAETDRRPVCPVSMATFSSW